MPQFHETGYGRRFFEAQLPDLIKSIEKIGYELEAARKQPEPDDTPPQELKETAASILYRFYNYCMDEHDGMLREEFIPMFLENEKLQ